MTRYATVPARAPDEDELLYFVPDSLPATPPPGTAGWVPPQAKRRARVLAAIGVPVFLAGSALAVSGAVLTIIGATRKSERVSDDKLPGTLRLPTEEEPAPDRTPPPPASFRPPPPLPAPLQLQWTFRSGRCAPFSGG